MWVYLWAFYLVLSVYISVSVQVPHCLDVCTFVVYSEVQKVDSSSFIFLSQNSLTIHSLLCPDFPIQSLIFSCSCSVKNSMIVRWMNLDSVIQSEVSQKEKNKYCILMHIYGI